MKTTCRPGDYRIRIDMVRVRGDDRLAVLWNDGDRPYAHLIALPDSIRSAYRIAGEWSRRTGRQIADAVSRR